MTSHPKAPKQRKRRKSGYTPAIGRAICKLLAEGLTLNQVCERLQLASRTVRRWAMENDEFAPHYARARELGYQKMADELIDIADDGRNDWMDIQRGKETIRVVDKEAVARSQIRIDTRKWILAKALPKIYGDKLDLKHNAGDGFLTMWKALSSGQVEAPQ